MTSHLEDHVIPASRRRERARGILKWIGQDMKRVEEPRLLPPERASILTISICRIWPIPPYSAAPMLMPASSQ